MHDVALLGDFDGDQEGYSVAKAAEIKRKGHVGVRLQRIRLNNHKRNKMGDIDEKLRLFVEEALRLGFDRISEGDHHPFALLLDSDGREHVMNLQTTSGEINASLVESGRDVIRAFPTGRMYALVWDGYLTTDAVKQDAVSVEAGKRADKTAYVFAQRYKQNEGSNGLTKDGSPLLVQDAKHLWKASKSRPKYTSESVYTILHSKDLANMFRSSRSGMFTEGKKWTSAERLLRAARSAGQAVPVIFAPGEDIRELTYFAEIDDLKISQDEDGKWSTTVSVRNLTKIRPPRPKKTQLKVCSTGERLPANHIRPYVLVETPSFLTKEKKGK